MSSYTPRKPTLAKSESPKPLLGTELSAKCRKCRAVTKHVVLAKIGVKPTQVRCLTCNDEHPYRTQATRRAVDAAPREQSWAEVMQRAPGAATPYSVSASYAVGARVSHASFGEGVVVRLASSTVCEVLFESRAVKLVMASTDSRFVAPEPRAASARRRPRLS
jgi:hypothetical protein